MCLNFISKEKTAKKDITVYKVLRFDDDSDSLVTYYQHQPVKIGETYSSKILVEIDDPYEYIEIGLHSFTKLKDLKTFCDLQSFNSIPVKCVIPAGSKYYTGKFYTFLDEYDSIVSDKLTYVEILKK